MRGWERHGDRYNDHAAFQIARRGIDEAWIEAALAVPDVVEPTDRRRSFLKCLPGRRLMLRVVNPLDGPSLFIAAYFDRTRPCA